MKQKLSLLFLICILSALNINATVYSGSCGTNVRYSLDTSTGVLKITGTGAMTNYSPSSSSFAPWYSNRSYVKTVEISNSVTSIGSYAFYDCRGLTSVTIGNSVTSIGNYAFDGCSGLTSITIPNSVTNIGDYAFDGCSGLTSITIPNSVTSIGYGAFSGCRSLTSISVDNGNEEYDSRDNCDAIIETASNTLIAGCKNTTIPNSVTSIGYRAFYGRKGLTSVTIPNSVTSIGSQVFWGCSGLTSVTIPNSVTSIGDWAFADCSGLTSVTIPNSVTSIGTYAFKGCSGLTSISVENGNEKYDSRNNCDAIIETASNTLIAGCKNTTIPNSVTSIGEGAFNDCRSLTSVTIGNSVTSIGSSAFYNCKSLTSVTIPNSVTSIGNHAFYGCKGLTSVTIPNSVKSIGNYAFYYCSGLTSVTIGNSVTSIGNYAFDGCSELADVYCYAKNVLSTGSNAFKYSYVEYATLYVPEASVAAYKATEPWSGFGTIKTLSGEIPVVEKCATPTISYENGKLKFSCATEGATCQYSITDTDIKAGSGNEVQLTTTYKVTVYATKAGYENSDEATLEINVSGGTSGLRGDVNNDGTVNMPDAMFIVNKILNGKFPDE